MAVIMLIEDSLVERAIFSKWLEKAGHTVVIASSAEDGLNIIRGRSPDLVLMDVVLPGMNGFQATRTLSRDEALRHIPVLIVSTKGMAADRAWGLRQGAVDYFVKPPSEQELIARINELVCQ